MPTYDEIIKARKQADEDQKAKKSGSNPLKEGLSDDEVLSIIRSTRPVKKKRYSVFGFSTPGRYWRRFINYWFAELV